MALLPEKKSRDSDMVLLASSYLVDGRSVRHLLIDRYLYCHYTTTASFRATINTKRHEHFFCFSWFRWWQL